MKAYIDTNESLILAEYNQKLQTWEFDQGHPSIKVAPGLSAVLVLRSYFPNARIYYPDGETITVRRL